jgi:N-acetylmuramoyl-L-alanine amidase
MVRALVQDNADTIADRLPAPLRLERRLLARWARHGWLLALPVSLMVGSALVAHRSFASPPAVAAAAQGDAGAQAVGNETTAAAVPDSSMLSRPVHLRSLALGVRRVILDAGHGGEHLGTVSASGLAEKDVTLDLAERARQLLVQKGLDVVVTRASDATLSLKERSALANEKRGDIFVSIHLNSLEPKSARGIETYYLGPSEHPQHEAIAASENEHSGYSLGDMRALLDGIYADARRDESKRLAQAVQRAMVGRMRLLEPAIVDRGVKTAPFVVLVGTEMPAILAEVACLSNADEAKRLGTSEYRQTIAEALVSGIHSFVDQKRHPVAKGRDTNER